MSCPFGLGFAATVVYFSRSTSLPSCPGRMIMDTSPGLTKSNEGLGGLS